MNIDIVDIGFGNIQSVRSWLRRDSLDGNVVSDPEDLSSELILLPGVGSAGPYMFELKKLGFLEAIIKHVEKGHRLFGICLGFQILFENSEEDGGTPCLGLIKGEVKRLKNGGNHNGWEPVSIAIDHYRDQKYWGTRIKNRRKHLKGRAYYNHEYGVLCDQFTNSNLKISSELSQYTSFIVNDNIAGVQFHPEKSQTFGSNLLRILF